MKMRKLVSCVMLFGAGIQLQAGVTYTLADCREMATSHSKDLKIAVENVNAAESLKKVAKTGYLPDFSANGGFIHNQRNMSLLGEDKYLPVFNFNSDGSVNYAGSWNNGWTSYSGQIVPTDVNGIPFNPSENPEKILWKNKALIPKDAFEFDSRNIFVGAFTVTQPLFLGGKIVQLNRLADSNKKLAEAQKDGKIAQTLVDIEFSYWRIVSLAGKVKLAESYVDLLKKLDSDIEKSILIGVATKSDGLSVKVKLNEAEMSLMQAQDGLNLSRMALCQLCGLSPDSDFRLADEINDNMIGTEDGFSFTDDSVSERYELKILSQAVNIAESSEKIAVSRFLPNAVMTAGYMMSNPNFYNGFEKDFAGQYQIGVVVNVPIFHFGEKVNALRAAKSEKQIARFKLEEAKEKIELDIAQARFKYKESLRKVQMTALNRKKAEENLHYAKIGFDAGTISVLALTESQTAWLKACSEDIDATIDVRMNSLQLKKALGYLY